MDWINARIRETSSWVGLLGLAATANNVPTISPYLWSDPRFYLDCVTLLASVVAIVLPENRKD